jgi:hypothetical protein
MTPSVSPEADWELTKEAVFYARAGGAELGGAFVTEFERALALLCDHPELKLYPDGRHEEIFNGPGQLIYDRYAARKGIGVVLLSFPVSELRKLSEQVPEDERIRRRG